MITDLPWPRSCSGGRGPGGDCEICSWVRLQSRYHSLGRSTPCLPGDARWTLHMHKYAPLDVSKKKKKLPSSFIWTGEEVVVVCVLVLEILVVIPMEIQHLQYSASAQFLLSLPCCGELCQFTEFINEAAGNPVKQQSSMPWKIEFLLPLPLFFFRFSTANDLFTYVHVTGVQCAFCRDLKDSTIQHPHKPKDQVEHKAGSKTGTCCTTSTTLIKLANGCHNFFCYFHSP